MSEHEEIQMMREIRRLRGRVWVFEGQLENLKGQVEEDRDDFQLRLERLEADPCRLAKEGE